MDELAHGTFQQPQRPEGLPVKLAFHQRLLSLLLVIGMAAQLVLLVHAEGRLLQSALAVVMAAHLGLAWLVLRPAHSEQQASGSEGLASTLDGIAQALHDTHLDRDQVHPRPRLQTQLGWQSDTLHGLPGLETAAALRRLQGDMPLYQQRLRAFVQAYGNGLMPWLGWIDSSRWTELEEAAHRLQFQAGEIGARKVQAAALRLEMQVACEDSLGAQACLPALQEDLGALLGALRQAALPLERFAATESHAQPATPSVAAAHPAGDRNTRLSVRTQSEHPTATGA